MGKPMERVTTAGKHLAVNGTRMVARGVTYGSFRTRSDGFRVPAIDQIERDFDQIAALGLNTVRVYSVPPRDLLTAAGERGLRVIAGIDFRDWRYESPGRTVRRKVLADGCRALDEALETCAGQAEVLALCIANEVPGDIVRVHGHQAVSDVLSELVARAHSADGELLVTYGNYPTTEYLEVEGLDLLSFNVFLEQPEQFRPYLDRLQIIAGDRPLIIGELGLASEMHGAHGQALTLDWQLQMIDEAGLAGATVFSWTDEWYVNDEPVDGWGFGLTTADREPKPAVEVVSTWATRTELDRRDHWPTISVVVCAYNEERHLDNCLSSLARCEYPSLEIIVCDDGSTDRTLGIARSFPFRTLALPHGGLSEARNAGMDAATGEIVAYLDADATCDPQWLWFLARGFDDPTVVAAGGPNLPYAAAGLVERAVALSPGSPAEVLVSDARAEHVPGCNMAFRVDALRAIGGFDARYTSAGDDVDVCWKLLDAGGEIAFVPAAQVWHRRRATIRGYLRQQRGYGRAERMLAAAHAHRFNRLGQARWRGAIYQPAGLLPRVLRPIVYHGHQGHAPFQHVVSRRSDVAQQWIGAFLPFVVPAVAASVALTSLSSAWWLAVAALMLGVVGYGAAMAVSTPVRHDETRTLALRLLVGLLHVLQPFARVWGRARGRAPARATTPAPAWWGSRAAWLTNLERALLTRKIGVRIGGPSDGWDLEARLGLSLRARVTTGVAWQWNPMHRRRWLPPKATTAVVAAAACLAVGSRQVAGLVAVASIVVSAGSTWVLHRRLDDALSTSTVGARRDDLVPAKVSRSSIVESQMTARESVA